MISTIGHHSLFMSSHADRVFSFEPLSVVRNKMQRKLRHAGVGNVTISTLCSASRGIL